MQIISETKVLILNIEYQNDRDATERRKVIEYLDERFGKARYSIKRMGPKDNNIGRGLMTIHVDQSN